MNQDHLSKEALAWYDKQSSEGNLNRDEFHLFVLELIDDLKREAEKADTIQARERERCAKLVEVELYPTEKTEYQQQYNAGIRALAAKIRSGE